MCRSRLIFVGAKDFSRIFPIIPKNVWGLYSVNTLSLRPLLGWPAKKIIMWFCTHVGRHIFKSNHVVCHFCPYFQGVWPDFNGFCEGFHRFCPDFPRFAPIYGDFARIFTISKLLEVRFHHRLLHHWMWPTLSLQMLHRSGNSPLHYNNELTLQRLTNVFSGTEPCFTV